MNGTVVCILVLLLRNRVISLFLVAIRHISRVPKELNRGQIHHLLVGIVRIFLIMSPVQKPEPRGNLPLPRPSGCSLLQRLLPLVTVWGRGIRHAPSLPPSLPPSFPPFARRRARAHCELKAQRSARGSRTLEDCLMNRLLPHTEPFFLAGTKASLVRLSVHEVGVCNIQHDEYVWLKESGWAAPVYSARSHVAEGAGAAPALLVAQAKRLLFCRLRSSARSERTFPLDDIDSSRQIGHLFPIMYDVQ